MRKEDEREKGERIISAFKKKYDREGQVCILWSSDDPGLADFFNYSKTLGLTDQGLEGEIFVQLHDADPNREYSLKATVLEELGHALQFKRQGNVSSDGIWQRELEVAECMINRVNQGRLNLSENDLKHYQKAIKVYGKYGKN
jgi:hypothetical protein